jgi:hypothetical protein
VRDPWNDSELVRRFRAHSETALPRAPLNSALCSAIAADRSLSTLLGHAPPNQQLPVLLLATIHDRLLAEPDHPLAAWYPNLTIDPRDPLDPELSNVLSDFVHERSPAILHLLETRRVQTNEVGRCALLLPAFELVSNDVGPLVHIDVGTSAGLTTLLPHLAFRYDDGPTIGDSDLVIECGTRGTGPTPTSIPVVAAAVGLDRDPLDPTDSDDARWLQACCWPDQTDRFQRLAAAISIAGEHPPTVVRGDAVDDLALLVAEADDIAHPIITTTWVLNYLDTVARRGFVERLDELGRTTDISWVSAESPALTTELPHPADLAGEDITALTVVTWRDGERRIRSLATCHPHGYWLHWR